MPTPRDGFASVDGLRLHYQEWGDPDSFPLLLLHGGSANTHWWDFFAPLLAGRYRLVAPDLRGHGESGWHEEGRYGIDEHATDLRGLVKELRLQKLAVIGHSFGGMVATAFALREPKRLAALVLVDSRLHLNERTARIMQSLARLPQPVYPTVEDALRRFRLLPAASTAPERVLHHITRHTIRELDDGSWTLKFDRRTLAATRPCNLSPRLAEIPCPILLVRGGDSDYLSKASFKRWAASTPRARQAEIAAAHHHVMLDQPAALAAAVEEFLGTIPLLAADRSRV